MAEGDVQQQAEETLSLVLTDPRLVQRRANETLRRAREDNDAQSASMAERALGLAARELGDIEGAVAHVRRSISIAEGAGLETSAGESHVALTWLLAYRGDTAGALKEVELASGLVHGLNAARLQMMHALVLWHLGRLDEALQGNRRALAVFRQKGDRLWEAMCLNNRGLVHTDRGNLRRAEEDLREAGRLYRQLGNHLAVADTRWNLGLTAARGGDFVSALELYDQADEHYHAHGVPRPNLLMDRCELLLSVRLIPEARQAAERAVEELARARRFLELADGRLMLSHAALLGGDMVTARAMAERAGTAFRRQQRPGWVALASYATVRAGWLGGSRSAADLRRALRTADALSDIGWAVPALDARLLAARQALALGRTEAATGELARASRARRGGPMELRMRAWHAEALLRLSRGDRRGADTALRTGVRILNQHRAALGATELRAHASGHGAELATLGLSLAISSGRPERVLRWMERWRAGTLLLRPARPPEDAALAGELAELRHVVAQLDEAVLAGRRPDALLRRQAALEAAIRRRSWQASGSGASGERPAVGAGSVAEALGERALVEIAEEQGALWAVALAGGKLRLRRLGTLSEVISELEALRFALRRLALGGPDRLLQVAGEGVTHAAGRLNDLLLAPLASHVGERPLVIVPTGPLHAVPWSLLPSCSGRPVTVAPSAGLWMEAMRRASGPAPTTGVVLVAGPGLAGAESEVAALQRSYPEAGCLRGEAARVEEVTRSLDGAGLAHLATHGRFRADNPLFSSLQLADGPLMVYDLERLDSAPRLVVLSACDSGLSGVHPGDELMGLASALFALGAATLVASVVPVPDEATHALMLEFHRGLRLRRPPATALMAAQTAIGSPSPTKLVAGAGFVCFGAS